ncbi:MAG: hypothetical protein HN564_06365 [Flavobacteriales bacterium]|nr:hypothetical protein [Flavobacteriales bacterium]
MNIQKSNNNMWPIGLWTIPSTEVNTVNVGIGRLSDTWENMLKRQMGCTLCKEFRDMCKGCNKEDNHAYCANCKNEYEHRFFKSKNNQKCICNSECLELLLEKKKAIEERYNLVLWLYLIREQKSAGKKYTTSERRKYGCLQPDFIYVLFRPYLDSAPYNIPLDYLSTWINRWYEERWNEEREEEYRRWRQEEEEEEEYQNCDGCGITSILISEFYCQGCTRSFMRSLR